MRRRRSPKRTRNRRMFPRQRIAVPIVSIAAIVAVDVTVFVAHAYPGSMPTSPPAVPALRNGAVSASVSRD